LNFVDSKDKSGNVTYAAKDQKDDFWNYINQDSYLKSRKGIYTHLYNILLSIYIQEKVLIQFKIHLMVPWHFSFEIYLFSTI